MFTMKRNVMVKLNKVKFNSSFNLTKSFLRYYSSAKPTPRQEELMKRGLPKQRQINNVKDIVVIASGKGGVGKTTTAVNLAVALSKLNKIVGILDGDIFGPTVPLMMNVKENPLIDENNMMIPPINYGIKCLSMGLLVEKGPMIWRGPLVMSALQRLLLGAIWGPLDILIVDTPPGTGDVHLSLAQHVPISGVVLVSTPQTAALDVTKRGAEMFTTLKIPIIGLVENMSNIVCNKCQNRIELYSSKTDFYIDEMNIKLLDRVPIEPIITQCSDVGTPISIKYEDSETAKVYTNISLQIIDFLNNEKKTSYNQ